MRPQIPRDHLRGHVRLVQRLLATRHRYGFYFFSHHQITFPDNLYVGTDAYASEMGLQGNYARNSKAPTFFSFDPVDPSPIRNSWTARVGLKQWFRGGLPVSTRLTNPKTRGWRWIAKFYYSLPKEGCLRKLAPFWQRVQFSGEE